ncbi:MULTISPECIES: DUF2293 domain-containing protein [Mycolicibacterium]|uniref:DUF2293 domain-containing protein n=2 Tax=Mycolicibacterium TaxID=1866885 RepID=A0A7I7UGX3_MYCPV|nr:MULTISPECIES: DUF2293 domain-containing protein [Mycolicibacterium]MCV6978664.1 DUF2293 domain-containing protein [Mycolicibacterium pulveris]MCV7220833.1 DUF2293 domain-containing protein [Mycolicibacterium elephantis]RWA20877.1 hypothetical protein MELE44368_02690 [Mycolicibacterium elephantis DSM 44368]BBY80143.1 hypothetical protein MPUL_13010 [Mycolicibacterium pulveris]
MATLHTRVARIAEATMAEHGFVSPVDVLVGLGWLAQVNVERWEMGRVPVLARCAGVDADKLGAALIAVQQWARDRELHPYEMDYRDRQFSEGGDPDTERAYRTQWGLPGGPDPVSERPRQRPQDIVVISPHDSFVCDACDEPGDLLVKDPKGTLCLDCADLDHLEFLPSGDAALTRRARKASRLSAVVVRWSRRRKRYERQGVLVEPAAIEQAAQECLSDADARARRRERDRSRRAVEDEEFRGEFAAAIRRQFPGCPAERAEAIALHAAARGSGRAGRSAAGRSLDREAVRLAVAASVRHLDTDYDDLLMSGYDRDSARAQVYTRVEDVLDAWRRGVVTLDGPG